PRYTSSGGKVTMRHTEPPGGGSIVCGRGSVSVRPSMRAGGRSVTQRRVAAYPGRAGSVRTSGDGPSWMAVDVPFPSSTAPVGRAVGRGPVVDGRGLPVRLVDRRDAADGFHCFSHLPLAVS